MRERISMMSLQYLTVHLGVRSVPRGAGFGNIPLRSPFPFERLARGFICMGNATQKRNYKM